MADISRQRPRPGASDVLDPFIRQQLADLQAQVAALAAGAKDWTDTGDKSLKLEGEITNLQADAEALGQLTRTLAHAQSISKIALLGVTSSVRRLHVHVIRNLSDLPIPSYAPCRITAYNPDLKVYTIEQPHGDEGPEQILFTGITGAPPKGLAPAFSASDTTVSARYSAFPGPFVPTAGTRYAVRKNSWVLKAYPASYAGSDPIFLGFGSMAREYNTTDGIAHIRAVGGGGAGGTGPNRGQSFVAEYRANEFAQYWSGPVPAFAIVRIGGATLSTTTTSTTTTTTTTSTTTTTTPPGSTTTTGTTEEPNLEVPIPIVTACDVPGLGATVGVLQQPAMNGDIVRVCKLGDVTPIMYDYATNGIAVKGQRFTNTMRTGLYTATGDQWVAYPCDLGPFTVISDIGPVNHLAPYDRRYALVEITGKRGDSVMVGMPQPTRPWFCWTVEVYSTDTSCQNEDAEDLVDTLTICAQDDPIAVPCAFNDTYGGYCLSARGETEYATEAECSAAGCGTTTTTTSTTTTTTTTTEPTTTTTLPPDPPDYRAGFVLEIHGGDGTDAELTFWGAYDGSDPRDYGTCTINGEGGPITTSPTVVTSGPGMWYSEHSPGYLSCGFSVDVALPHMICWRIKRITVYQNDLVWWYCDQTLEPGNTPYKRCDYEFSVGAINAGEHFRAIVEYEPSCGDTTTTTTPQGYIPDSLDTGNAKAFHALFFRNGFYGNRASGLPGVTFIGKPYTTTTPEPTTTTTTEEPS